MSFWEFWGFRPAAAGVCDTEDLSLPRCEWLAGGVCFDVRGGFEAFGFGLTDIFGGGRWAFRLSTKDSTEIFLGNSPNGSDHSPKFSLIISTCKLLPLQSPASFLYLFFGALVLFCLFRLFLVFGFFV